MFGSQVVFKKISIRSIDLNQEDSHDLGLIDLNYISFQPNFINIVLKTIYQRDAQWVTYRKVKIND